jgi:type VI secretion system secreted protein Hcp
MAYDAFLKLDGIEGESTDKDHKGEIDIMSFSLGESQVGGRGAGAGSGRGAGKVSMQDIHFSTNMSKASPQLFLACASGKHISNGLLTLRKAGEQQLEFLKIKLTDVLVSSYQTGGNVLDNGLYSPLRGEAEVPTDQFSLNFSRINVTFTPQSAAGGDTSPLSVDAGG